MNITITLGKSRGGSSCRKPIRDSLGLREGTRLRIENLGAESFRRLPKADDVRIQIRGGLPVIHRRAGRGKKGDIVSAIKAGREEQTDRILARPRQKSEGGPSIPR